FEEDSGVGRIVRPCKHDECNAGAQAYEDPDEAKAPAPSDEPNDGIDVHRVSVVGAEKFLGQVRKGQRCEPGGGHVVTFLLSAVDPAKGLRDELGMRA